MQIDLRWGREIYLRHALFHGWPQWRDRRLVRHYHAGLGRIIRRPGETGSPRQCPAVAAWVGAGEQHAARRVAADDLDAARAVEIADRLDRVTAAREFRAHRLGKATLDGQRVRAVMRPVGVLAGDIRGP